MNSLKSCVLVRRSFNYVIGPALLLGLRAVARVTGYRRLSIGKLSVLGDASFLSLCNSSVERLERLDPILHRLLTNRPVWLFHSAKAEPYVGNLGPPWLFSVHPRAVEWGSDGMVARLVYIAFCISRFPAGYARPEEAEATHKAVMALSHSWLESRSFPHELAESGGFF
jgi:hypothetical protein